MPKYSFNVNAKNSAAPKDKDKLEKSTSTVNSLPIPKSASLVKPQSNEPSASQKPKAFGFNKKQISAPSALLAPAPPIDSLENVYNLVLAGRDTELAEHFKKPDSKPINPQTRSGMTIECEKNKLLLLFRQSLASLLVDITSPVNIKSPLSLASLSAPLPLDLTNKISSVVLSIKDCAQKSVSLTSIESSFSSIAPLKEQCPIAFNIILKQLSDSFLVDKYSFNSIVLSHNLLVQKESEDKLESKKIAQAALKEKTAALKLTAKSAKP